MKQYSNNQEKKLCALKLVWGVIGTVAVITFCGCGNGCGQTLECDSKNVENTELTYLSIPFCGGCFTSEWGCNSCLWGENCVVASVDDEDGEQIMCNEYYYGDSCLGCGDTLESVYIGGASYDDGISCYFGSTSSDDEYICGTVDGCVCGGKNEGNEFAGLSEYIKMVIEAAEIDEKLETENE